MTVGLIRTEAAGGLRTLTATIAGALAPLGALTGAADAYLALAARHSSDPGILSRVPILYLTSLSSAFPPPLPHRLAPRRPPATARHVLG